MLHQSLQLPANLQAWGGLEHAIDSPLIITGSASLSVMSTSWELVYASNMSAKCIIIAALASLLKAFASLIPVNAHSELMSLSQQALFQP